ncbi:hypothetical protein [Gluconacetobacter tumulisoli]|uniref:DUF4412 domain-containing protein n=1 Tax=Gluconacetobacter tumulisoli TaxID=1286189 RepID=A0A7W4K4P6_9PROT|nr:hypothetical protein [Gluconacetobacter tumulisoli]MBB2200175.1 hypothetical protein [Gluconacetobacter tumulisoli]
MTAFVRPPLAGVLAGMLVMAPVASRAADDAPFVTPQHDVDVTYAIASPDPSRPQFRQRMRWSGEQQRQRVDPEGSSTFMITDYRKRLLTVVDMAHRARTTIPAPGPALTTPGQRATGVWARGPSMTVAGQPCIVWHTTDTDGRASDVCYTDDGVMLQVVQNGRVLVQADSLSRSAQPDPVFAIPDGLAEVRAAHP